MIDSLNLPTYYERFNLAWSDRNEPFELIAVAIWQEALALPLAPEPSSAEIDCLTFTDLYSATLENDDPFVADRPRFGPSETIKYSKVMFDQEAGSALSLLKRGSARKTGDHGKSEGLTIDLTKPTGGDGGKNSAIDRIAAMIARHEGAPDRINWNDNGAGISVGMFQANQRYGELPALLQRMQKADRQLFTKVFGIDFADLISKAPDKVRLLAFTNAQKSGPNELGARLKEAVKMPRFQKVQLEMLHEKIRHAAQVAEEYGITSERGVALVADMLNQLGEGSAPKHGKPSGARQYLQYALAMRSEADKLKAITEHDLKGFGRARRDNDILTSNAWSTGISALAQRAGRATHSLSKQDHAGLTDSSPSPDQQPHQKLYLTYTTHV